MDNRFGLKDFFLFALVLAVLVAVVLAMVQFDRQWTVIQQIQEQNRLLASDLNRLGSGGGTSGGQPQIVQNFYGVGGAPGSATPTPAPAVAGTDAVEQAPVLQDDATFALLEEAEREPGFARGGWFLDNFGTSINRLTPLVSIDVYASWVQGLVLEGLVQRDPYTLEFQPKLAESWEISEDGLTMTFKLREGVRFSDGEPVTSEDVTWTFDWIRNPEVQADRSRAYLDKLASVEAIDERTVRFTFTSPYFLNFETAAGTAVLPKHFYENYTPTQFNEALGALMGSGPYMMPDPVNWTPAQDVTIVRNPRYWGPQPTFDAMNFKQVSEEAAQEVMLRNGELDRYAATPDNFDKLKADADLEEIADAYSYDTIYGGYTYVGWNQLRQENGAEAETIFADKRVRQAMTMLMDRERLAEELYMGYASVADGPFAPAGPQSAPDVEPWPHDVERATDLLAEAGWEDRNGDGVLEDDGGKLLRFTLIYPGGSQFTEKIVLSLQDDLARGGVLMELERLDWPVLLERLTSGNFEACTLGWSSSPESDPYQVFHSSQAKIGGDNRLGYKSPELDVAIETARTTMDEEQRMPLWHEVHRILHEDQPVTFLLNRQALRFFNKRVHNVRESPMGLNFEYMNGGVLPWFIPADQQQQTR